MKLSNLHGVSMLNVICLSLNPIILRFGPLSLLLRGFCEDRRRLLRLSFDGLRMQTSIDRFGCPRVLLFYRKIQLQYDHQIYRELPIRHIESHRINCILMPFKSMQKIPRLSIPNLTSSIIAASDKLIPIFIEPTVSKW